MSIIRNVVGFGRKAVGASAVPTSSAKRLKLDVQVDSDGKKRIFGEKIFETHGDFLRMLGRDIDDPENILPTEEDHQRALQESLDGQKHRHAALEAELCRKHGIILIWPFYIFGDPVWHGPDGLWLMRAMKLLPGDDWNILYLASNRESSEKINLPMHPGGGIDFVDDKVKAQVHKFRLMFDHLMDSTDPFSNQGESMTSLGMFVERKQVIHNEILGFANFTRQRLLEMLWQATRNTG